MEPEAKKRFRIASLCTLAGLALVGGIWMHQRHVISYNHQATQSEQMSTKKYRHDGQTFTIAKLERRYDNSEPNLGTALQTNRTRVIKGLRLAFNDCHRMPDYDRNKKTITTYLGTDVGNRILKVVQPQISDQSSSNRPISNSQSLTSFKVSYGQYDDSQQAVPLMILLTYKSIPMTSTSTSLNGGRPHNIPHTGHVAINAMMSPNDGAMQLNSGYDSIDGMDN